MFSNSRRLLIALALGLGIAVSGCATHPSQRHSETFIQARSAWLADDYETALPMMQAEAELGNPEAQYALGYMHYHGQGTEVDLEAARKWISLSAEQGYPQAIRALSQLAALGTRRSG